MLASACLYACTRSMPSLICRTTTSCRICGLLRTCSTAVRFLLYIDTLRHTFCLYVCYCDLFCDWLHRYNKSSSNRNPNCIASICCGFDADFRFVVDFCGFCCTACTANLYDKWNKWGLTFDLIYIRYLINAVSPRPKSTCLSFTLPYPISLYIKRGMASVRTSIRTYVRP